MSRSNTTGAKRPLLQRIISRSQSSTRPIISILTNPASTRAQPVLPTIHEEVTPSPLSTVCQAPSPSPVTPRAYSILDNLARAYGQSSIQNTHSSSPSVRKSRLPPRITILSDLEREKHEAHPHSSPDIKSILLNAAETRSLSLAQGIRSSSPSVSRSRSHLHIPILSDPEKEKREAHPQSPKGILINPPRTRSLPSVTQTRSPSHITILSDLEKEKREARPLSPPKPKSILLNLEKVRSLPSIQIVHSSSPSSQSLSPPHVTILNNPEKEKSKAYPHPTQRTKSIRNVLASALVPKRVPIITMTPISILKAPEPPHQTPVPVPAPAADPNPDAVKENVKVKSILSDIVVQETIQGILEPEKACTGAHTIMTSSKEMLSVPLVDWRGRLDEDEDGLSRCYPKEHTEGQFVHRLRSMVRSGSRSTAARRRDHVGRRRQIATTTTNPSIAVIARHTCP